MANRVECGYFLFDVRCADKRNCHVLSFMFRPLHPSKQEGPQLRPLENPQLLNQIPPSSATNACTPQSLHTQHPTLNHAPSDAASNDQRHQLQPQATHGRPLTSNPLGITQNGHMVLTEELHSYNWIPSATHGTIAKGNYGYGFICCPCVAIPNVISLLSTYCSFTIDKTNKMSCPVLSYTMYQLGAVL